MLHQGAIYSAEEATLGGFDALGLSSEPYSGDPANVLDPSYILTLGTIVFQKHGFELITL